jgi:hypothetical protein
MWAQRQLFNLAAEIFRARFAIANQSRVTGVYPQDSQVSRLLSDMGFNNLMGIDEPDLPEDTGSVEYIRYKTSNDVKGELARELRLAIEAGSDALSPPIRRAMYGGLTEAMTNVLHHAYPKEIYQPIKYMRGRWWMAGSIDRENKELMMLFYDQGVGIPVTVPRKHPAEIWGGILSDLRLRPNDGNMIKAATMLGRTRTDQPNRGRGLQDVLEIVRICKRGELRILSNRGEYQFLSNGSENIINHRRGIGGTLIQWRLSNP